jgi:hypothetical protein
MMAGLPWRAAGPPQERLGVIMKERRRWKFVGAALAAASLVASVEAQSTVRKEVPFDRVWGGSYLNGFLHADAAVELEHEPYTAADGSPQNVYELSGGAHARGGLTLLFKQLEAFRFEADASLKDDTGKAHVIDVSTHGLMRIGGRTLLSFDRGWPLQDRQSFGPYSLLTGGVNKSIGILVFSVSIHGEAAGSLEGEATLAANRTQQGGRASIGLRARQYASLAANVHFWPVTAGVEASLDLPVAGAIATMRADLQDGVRGELAYAVDPISVVARAFGCIDLLVTQPCGSLTFLNWSSPAQRGSLRLE